MTDKTREGIATTRDEISWCEDVRHDPKPLLELLPKPYQFKQGHLLRIAFAGADNDHFQLLDDPIPTWDVWHIPDLTSHVELPVAR